MGWCCGALFTLTRDKLLVRMFAGCCAELCGGQQSILRNGNLKPVAHEAAWLVGLFCETGVIMLSVAVLLESSLEGFPAV